MSAKAVPLAISGLAVLMFTFALVMPFVPAAAPAEVRLFRVCTDLATTTPALWLNGGEHVGDLRPSDFRLADLTAFRIEPADETHWDTPWALSAETIGTSTRRLTVTAAGQPSWRWAAL